MVRAGGGGAEEGGPWGGWRGRRRARGRPARRLAVPSVSEAPRQPVGRGGGLQPVWLCGTRVGLVSVAVPRCRYEVSFFPHSLAGLMVAGGADRPLSLSPPTEQGACVDWDPPLETLGRWDESRPPRHPSLLISK